MNNVLREILETNQVKEWNNNVYKQHSHMEAQQGLKLQIFFGRT